LASWLTVVVLTVAIISLLVASIVALNYGSELSERIADTRLQAFRSLKAAEIERYFGTLASQTRALASSGMTTEAARQFNEAYVELRGQDPGAAASSNVARYYREDFGPRLEEATGVTVAWQNLVPAGDATVYLQHHYVAAADLEPGDQRLVDDAEDGSRWSEVHAEFHPSLRDIAERLEIDDLFIVEPFGGTIVYSAAKAPDFATSLDRGPYSASTPAALMRAVRDDPDPGSVLIADVAPYGPALGEPAAFLASPILADGRLAGVLVVRLPLDGIDLIMTSGGDWEREGLGATGESYLVGADGRMRSISRPYLEDRASYFASVAAAGSVSGTERDAVEALGTTAVFQRAASLDNLELAAVGPTSVLETTNYLGRDTYTTYELVDVEGLTWFVAVEVERDEVQQPVVDFRKTVLVLVSVFVLAITFVTVAWARRALAPVRAVGERLRRTLEGEPATGGGVPAGGPMEVDVLGDSLARMVEMTEERRRELARAGEERLDALRGLLPPMIAERIEAGDRLVVERVAQASVVVIELAGLGDLIHTGDPASSRAHLDRVVGVLDTLGGNHGLERVKVIGNVYYAGCGLNEPYLDHAPRAVGFAFEALRRLRELSDELPGALEPAAGIHSGPVSVGLTGSSRLLYDVWGESLTVTYLLAQRARSGEILVSEETKGMLPDEFTLQRSEDGQQPPAWRVTRESVMEGAASDE
jgi:class 3 adenylate cyclase